MCDDRVVGLTTTIPVEIVLAAGLKPVDLNNIFINTERPEQLIRQAESVGFSHNSCAWIKGIYSTVINRGVKNVIAVTGGDCSNTIALSELLIERGVNVIHFDYPVHRDRDLLRTQMGKLINFFSVTWVRKVRVSCSASQARLHSGCPIQMPKLCWIQLPGNRWLSLSVAGYCSR